jgi:hypothetical protein
LVSCPAPGAAAELAQDAPGPELGAGAFARGPPRTLAEIIKVEQEFFDKVWYVRSIAHDDDKRGLPGDIRMGMMANRERVEAVYGRDELWRAIGLGHEEAWQYGYMSRKLATLRWVLGSEWDFLDT